MKRIIYYSLLAASLFWTSCSTPESAPESDEFKIAYEKFTLDNGLEVILHEDHLIR